MYKMAGRLILIPITVLILACAPAPKMAEVALPAAGEMWHYPEARFSDVVWDYHGTAVADPYAWLEDPDDPETMAWVEAQNRLTRDYLESIPARNKFEARLTELWNYARYGVPSRHGEWYYYFKNDGLQNQSVLYRARDLADQPEIVLDPNTFSADGTVALAGLSYSHDGRYLAYRTSEGGSDWRTAHIRDLDTGTDLADEIRWMKFGGLAWQQDNSGFYYTRFPDQAGDMTVDQTVNSKVFWHTLGTSQSEDKEVFQDKEHPEYGYSPFMTEDGQYLGIYVWHGTDDRNGLVVRPTEGADPFTTLFDVGEAAFQPIGNLGSTFYMKTNLKAPKGRIFSLDVNDTGRDNWVPLVPETDDAISSAGLIGGRLVLQYMHNANEQLKVFGLDGMLIREVALPSLGQVGGWWGLEAAGEDEMFFSFTSFLYPSAILRHDLSSGETSQVWSSGIDLNPAAYETRQVWYTSKDDTRVSMFITHRKGIALDGSNPTILYGYGGFNIPILPSFSIHRLAWMEQGGVYAVANLRGGSEYGEEWHQAGMLGNKQNVFDDFIAAAEWLIENGYTSTPKLAIDGASNGGLLVATCLVQRPDLFGAALPRVPVIDMLRYHMFTAGRYWTGEYGNAEEDPEHFAFMKAYSPLHNVQAGVAYPPTLITTADTDDRVVSMHAKKFAATLQANAAGTNPVLIRIETKAGHGAGKPTSKQIAEQADLYGFLFKALGVEID